MDPIKIRVLSNNLYICKNKPKMDYLLKRSLWVAGLATLFLILAISCKKESKEETETIIAPEAIDLGLSVKWGILQLGRHLSRTDWEPVRLGRDRDEKEIHLGQLRTRQLELYPEV